MRNGYVITLSPAIPFRKLFLRRQYGTRYALIAMVLASSVNSGNGFDFRKDELQEMLGGIIDHDTNKLNVRTGFTEGYNYRVRKER